MPQEPWPVPSPNYQGSLADFKESVNPARRNFARQPTYESPGDAYVRLNKNNNSFFQEVKSMLDPKNLTGANAIEAALGINGKGKGLPITQRITSGLSGLVQGLGFAAGGEGGKVGVEGVKNTGLPARVVNKIKNETVLVHGSPIPGLTEIKPTASMNLISNENPGFAVSYGWKPEEVSSRTQLVKNVEFYAQGQKNYRITPQGEKIAPEPTGYVVKVNKNATAPTQKFLKEPGIIAKGNWASVKPLKIVDEIPMSGKTTTQLEQEFSKKIKRAGGKLPAKPKPVKTVSTVPPPRT